MLKTLRQFFSDFHRIAQDMQRIADCIAANREISVNATLKPEQIQEVVEALPLYRRRKVQA